MPEDATPGPLLADSVTRLGEDARGRVVISGSHGGVYPASLARMAGCRAAVFNDAGGGRDDAGVAGLSWLGAHGGMAAAAVAQDSARIGDAADMLARGVISHVNDPAHALGITVGMPCTEAARRLAGAQVPEGPVPPVREAREVLAPEGARCRLVLVDSASLVRAEDAGQVVVTGSHGALFGDDPANALKVDARLALFNDAGGTTGRTRLAALERRGVAAATVSAASARIGEARSSWRDGVISQCNAAARRYGGRPGMRAEELVDAALGNRGSARSRP